MGVRLFGCRIVLGAGAVAVFSFVHIFDVVFEQQQVRLGVAVYLERVAVIPFDGAFDFLIVLQDDNHQGMGVNLFFIVVQFGMGFCRRWLAFTHLNTR